jgi:cytochrome c-type biogenesis protein CcmE
MTRKRRRLLVVMGCVLGLSTATILLFQAFRSTGELFVVPSKIAANAPKGDRAFRLGGMVEAGSLQRLQDGSRPAVRFRVSDGIASVSVNYVGILPDLFREGQGVVTLGKLEPDGSFKAQEVLAKHDENYMPGDMADELKKTGWRPEMGAPPAAALWNAPKTSAIETPAPTKVGG